MYKRVIALLLVLGVLCSATACGEKPKTEFNLAMLRETVAPTFLHIILRDHKLVEKYVPDGVTVNWTTIASNDDMRDAIVSGAVDIGFISSSNLITANANGMTLVPLSATTNTALCELYSCREDVTSLEDLVKLSDTAKIASVSAIGNASHMAFKVACGELLGDVNYFQNNMVGMTLSDVLASTASSNELAAAIIAISPGVDFGDLTPILDLTEYGSKYCLYAINTTTEEFYEKNPALISAYYQAQNDALDIVLNQPDVAAATLQAYWEGCTIEEIKQILIDIQPMFGISESAYDNLSGFLYESELVPNAPKPFSAFPNYSDIPKVD